MGISRAVAKKGRRLLRRAAGRAVDGLANGIVLLVEGASRPTMGNAPKDLVFQEGKVSVQRLRPQDDDEYEMGTEKLAVERGRFAIPILLIPPLMVRTYVYDLRPEHSFARTLRNRGYDVFVLDFGVPDAADAGLKLDDYVTRFVPRAVGAVLEASGAERLSLVGYCMGGIFALLYAAAHEDARVANLVTIGSPVNFEKMGILTVAARLAHEDLVDAVMDRMGNVPGSLASQGFKLLSGIKSVTKYADLFIHLYDDEYVRGFDAINTWVNDLLPYPRDAFKQMVQDVVRGNKMLKRRLRFGDKVADLSRVEAPLLAFAGRTDNLSPVASAREVLDLVGSRDKTFLEVPGGHVGVVAGSSAPRAVWGPTADWLAPRSLA